MGNASSTTVARAAYATDQGTVPAASAPSPELGHGTNSRAVASQKDHLDDAAVFDQYYTRSDIAQHCVEVMAGYVADMRGYQWIEPSAGKGAFLRFMPLGSRGFDLAPKGPGIECADFLTLTLPRGRPLAFMGNPPFGKNASLAVRFVNHAALQGDFIAFILPRSFRKASIQNRIDRHLHLVHDEILEPNAFEFRGASHDVSTVFQIWERRGEERPLHRVAAVHPDFAFTTPALCDFVIQRVGARAGRIHHDRGASPNCHYFIRCNAGTWERLAAVMATLDFAEAARNVASNPSLAKSEIIALYNRATNVARTSSVSA